MNILMRDHYTALVLPHKQLEISLDYLAMNDAIDVLDFKETEISGGTQGFSSLGDLKGARVMVNYGLFPSTTIHAEVSRRDLSYGLGTFEISTLELSFRHNIFNKPYAPWPFLAIDLGYRRNSAADVQTRDLGQINKALQFAGLSDQYSIEGFDKDFIYIKDQSAPNFVFGLNKQGGPNPDFSLTDSSDTSFFARLILGKELSGFFTNVYLECGLTSIDGGIESSLSYYAQNNFSFFGQDFPAVPGIDLSRDEKYVQTGIAAFFQLPFDILAYGEYSYHRRFRESSLSGRPSNHILKGELTYYLLDNLAWVVGGTYYSNQYNGMIPFLFNTYSESSFDKKYAEAYTGLTLTF